MKLAIKWYIEKPIAPTTANKIEKRDMKKIIEDLLKKHVTQEAETELPIDTCIRVRKWHTSNEDRIFKGRQNRDHRMWQMFQLR